MTLPRKILYGVGLAAAGSVVPGRIGNLALLTGLGFVGSALFDLSSSGLFNLGNFGKDPLAFLGVSSRDVAIDFEEAARVPGRSGPVLSKPKNLLRVSGRITAPRDGGKFDIGLADTFPMRAQIENQGNTRQSGRVQLHVTELRDRLLRSSNATLIVNGPEITLQPGQLTDVKIQAPTALPGVGGVETTLGLFFDGHLLDRIVTNRSVL